MRETAQSLERARDVAIAGHVFCEQDVARRKAMARAVAELDFADATGHEDELARDLPVDLHSVAAPPRAVSSRRSHAATAPAASA